MPKLSKIRLTGCKYDGLKKEHEDSIFDLNKDGEPDHTLFTLCNGGGKGVMIQLIFQVLLPETRWGKNNGNKVISMFYDQRNNLHPFTFHVVLEWVLDTFPEKRLITGIAIKAIIKNTEENEEERAGLHYFIYTHEHDNKGYFTVENLPLYDKKNRTAVDIDEFEDFINSNKRDFTKYSKSNVKRTDSEYYRYLESRGIYRSDWVNLKGINKSEGGIGDYFAGASDNKAIFDKIIIPAISENIKNYTHDDGDSLIEMFKSNLSITKDLPVLISREGDYKELLLEIKPLIENANIGSGFMDIKERLIDEGNDIYFILKDQENLAIGEIEKWSNETEKAEEEKSSLEFKKDNLYYNKERKALESREKEADEFKIQYESKLKEIKESKSKLLLYRINNLLYQKKEVEHKIQNKIEEKQRLFEILDISNIKDKAKELDNQIEIEWEKTKDHWINSENQYIGYNNYNKQIIEQNNNQKKVYQTKINELQNNINKFEIKEKDLAKAKHKLSEYYDLMSLAFPERIIEDLLLDKENIKNDLLSINTSIDKYKEIINKLNEEINRLKYNLDNKEDNIKSLQEKSKKQGQYELRIAKMVTSQLMEDYDGSLLNHLWFQKKFDKLKLMEDDKNNNLIDIQRTIWEKNIDRLLNKEDYFIPNKDIIKIKEQIENLGIHVETGAEYLKKIDENEKLYIVENYPGFIYSLVIGNMKEWELIDKNIGDELFINNMVPIYIRSQMGLSLDTDFKMVNNKAYELINEDKYIKWKDISTNEIEELTETQENIKKDLENIRNIKQELNYISKDDTSFIINKKIREEENKRTELLEEIRIKEEEKLDSDNKLKASENNLGKSKHRLDFIETSIIQVEDYMEKIEVVEMEREKISKDREDINDLNLRNFNIDYDNDMLLSNIDEVKDYYYKWKAEIENVVNKVELIYKDAVYEHKADSSCTNSKIPDFYIKAERLLSLADERNILEEDMAIKDSKIAVLNTEIKHFNKDLDRIKKELKNIDNNWIEYDYLDLSINEIEIRINDLEKQIEKIEDQKEKAKASLDMAKGNIAAMKIKIRDKEEQIEKDHGKSAIILELDNIDSDINTVERDLKSNKKYLVVCKDELENNKNNKTRLEINLTKIKNGYILDLSKGKMNKSLKTKIENNPNSIVDEWLSKCTNNRNQIRKAIDEGERIRTRFTKRINLSLEEDKLKGQINTAIKEANIEKFKNNLVSFKSMENHFNQELLSLSKDKEKKEDIMNQWANRASIYVIRIIEALKNMTSSMNYINEQGYAFPLVKLKGEERLPKDESEIINLLKEYFIETIAKILETNKNIENIDDRELKKLMGDSVIFSKALLGRYPTLLVYKMSEENEFRYARPRDEYYTTWEAINKGEGDLPEGSGGQTLSVNTFVAMMIMSFKNKNIGNENPSTVLMLDNPFGKASARHVLDPIFEIADKLNFQLICFAAPEIIKVEISERFPIFWELKIEEGKIVHGGRIIR